MSSLSYAFFQSFVQYWWGVWRVVWEDFLKRKKEDPMAIRKISRLLFMSSLELDCHSLLKQTWIHIVYTN